jgi:hypothetical protein
VHIKGKMTGEAMPIAFVLTPTETGDSIANMFTSVREFLFTYEDGFNFYWTLVVSDHHVGVINKTRAIEQGTLIL